MRILITTIIFLLLCPVTAYAESDYFVSPDGVEHYVAGGDISDDPYNEIPPDENVYTEEEQQEMMEKIDNAKKEIEEERGDVANGYIYVSLTEPANWDESDITISLHNQTYRDINETLVLRKELGWKDNFEVPIGEYTFWKAETDSGTSFLCDLNTFEVAESGAASITLYINESNTAAVNVADNISDDSEYYERQDLDVDNSSAVNDASTNNVSELESLDDEELSDNSQTEYIYYDDVIEENEQKNNFARRIIILVVILCVVVALVLVSFFQNRRKKFKKDMMNNEGFGEFTQYSEQNDEKIIKEK